MRRGRPDAALPAADKRSLTLLASDRREGQTLRAATVARARSAAPKVRDAVALSQSMNQVATPAHKIVAMEHEFVEQTVSGALGLNLDTGIPGCAMVSLDNLANVCCYPDTNIGLGTNFAL